MKKAWAWVKSHVAALLVGAAVLFLTVFGITAASRGKKLGKLKDELAVSEGLSKVRELEARREEVAAQVGAKDAAVSELDDELLANKRKIVEAHEGGEGLTDEEVLDGFAELGI